MEIKSYRDLAVWQKSMELVVECYNGSKAFPASDMYGLTSQLRRAAVSVPANIAEGQGRQSTAEFLRHIAIAYGSLMELETHIQIAGRLGYMPNQEVNRLLELTGNVGRMINGLRKALQSKTRNPDH